VTKPGSRPGTTSAIWALVDVRGTDALAGLPICETSEHAARKRRKALLAARQVTREQRRSGKMRSILLFGSFLHV